MEFLIIDRIEGTYAICENEDKSFTTISTNLLPADIKEGSCLILDTDGTYQIDKTSTEERKNRIRDKMKRLFE